MVNVRRILICAAALALIFGAACSPKGPAKAAELPDPPEVRSELAAAPATSAASAAPAPPDAKALVESRCTVCHDLKRVDAEKADAAEWGRVVDTMIKKGAKLDAAERAAVVTYLAGR